MCSQPMKVTSKAENMINVTSDCDQHETGTKNTTFKNYTGVIKQNQNHYGNFKGEGQLTCTCGIEGYPTTVIESSPLEIYFYDCSISICFAVTFPISFVLIVISYGIIFFRRKRAGCLAFIIQWYCTIIIKVIFDLSILAFVIICCVKKDKRKVQKPDRQATEDELSEAPVASNLNQTENCAMKVNSSFVKAFKGRTRSSDKMLKLLEMLLSKT
ncbi:hypothetical protein KUTeg_011509 [Tegillarca granosa]|uniref:Uncharacterized protein n=1 Tax=Tegillarca granosa TaxID=220873 RepID=A0ABQ9F0K6_TEGGR|nr:hypothetical protein KUTeg_011509 [Tegillarca granosa]